MLLKAQVGFNLQQERLSRGWRLRHPQRLGLVLKRRQLRLREDGEPAWASKNRHTVLADDGGPFHGAEVAQCSECLRPVR